MLFYYRYGRMLTEMQTTCKRLSYHAPLQGRQALLCELTLYICVETIGTHYAPVFR
jgi:hypothetical protein